MLIRDFIRALVALMGALLTLLGLFGVVYALADGAWGPAFSALLGALLGFWIFNVGLTGRLSGRRSPDLPPTA